MVTLARTVYSDTFEHPAAYAGHVCRNRITVHARRRGAGLPLLFRVNPYYQTMPQKSTLAEIENPDNTGSRPSNKE